MKKKKKQSWFAPKIIACFACFLFIFLMIYLWPYEQDPEETFHHPVGILENNQQHTTKETDGQELITKNNQAKNRTNKLLHFTEPAIFQDPKNKNNSQIKEKRDKIRALFDHGFAGYAKFCYGRGEVRPLSQTCSANGRDLPDSPPMGFQIIANLDTFLLMGLSQHYERAKSWIKDSLKWSLPIRVSLFETTIRCLGGLVSAYQLTNESLFLDHAMELGNILLFAFNSSSRIPFNKISLDTKKPWGINTNLAEAGSLSLEFTSLSTMTNNPHYAQKVLENYRSIIQFRPSDTWLFAASIRPTDVRQVVFEGPKAIGGGTDSFYEYLLKYSLITNHADKVVNEWWRHTAEEIIEKHLRRINIDGVQMAYVNPTDQPNHLECFLGGVFALASLEEKDIIRKDIYKQVAEELGQLCRALYTIRTGTFTGLPVEAIQVRTADGSTTLSVIDASFQQRPEAVETWFYLWRLTKNEKYREWAWEYASALSKVQVDNGFVCLHSDGTVVDIQKGHFLAETLKYLFLIFCPDSVLPLEEYVFNTEAHPLRKFHPNVTYDLYIVSFPSL